MFTRMIFSHPDYGELRVSVNEEQKLLFLLCDVADMFGLTPAQTVLRIGDSDGELHFFTFQLKEDGEVWAPQCDEQLFADLTQNLAPKYKHVLAWVKEQVIPIAKDERRCKKYVIKKVNPIEECKDEKVEVTLTDNALLINHEVCIMLG